MDMGTEDQSANAASSRHATQSAGHPSEASRVKNLFGIGVGILIPVLGGMWYSLHDQINRVDGRVGETQAMVSQSQEHYLDSQADFLLKAAEQSVDHQNKVLDLIRQEFKEQGKDIQLQIDALREKMDVQQITNDERYADLRADVGSLLASAAGPVEETDIDGLGPEFLRGSKP